MNALWLTCAALAAVQTWTVDDDGPADFAGLQEAIDSAAVVDGDVLLVSPGSYGSFTLDKALRLVAPGGASFDVDGATVDGPSSFGITGMRAQLYLEVKDVSGRGVLEECEIGALVVEPGTGAVLWAGGTTVEDCGQLLITRSILHGSDGCYPEDTFTSAAVSVASSTVALVDCELYGGSEMPETVIPPIPCAPQPLFGSVAALEVRAGSDVTVAGSTLVGGNSSAFFPGDYGIWVEDSAVHVRGSSGDLLQGGPGPSQGAALGGSSATAAVSGVTVDPPGLPFWATSPSPPETALSVQSGSSPYTIELRGPAAGVGLVVHSLVPALVPTPWGNVWIGSTTFLPTVLVTDGQESPASYVLPLPASTDLAGIAVLLQGVHFAAPAFDVLTLTNPAQIVLRW